MPFEPVNAAAGLTLRSPLSVLLADQAEKLPLSKPSAKITSEAEEVGEGVKVCEGVAVAVAVNVAVAIAVFVAV